MMHKEGLINPANQAENGETFHLQFGSGKVGMMGTGNFNITLAREQNPGMNFGITLLPGLETGQVGELRRRRHRDGAERIEAGRGRGRLHEVHPVATRSRSRSTRSF